MMPCVPPTSGRLAPADEPAVGADLDEQDRGRRTGPRTAKSLGDLVLDAKVSTFVMVAHSVFRCRSVSPSRRQRPRQAHTNRPVPP